MISKTLVKGIAILSTVGFLGTAIAPETSAFAQEKVSQTVSYQTPMSQQEMDKIIQETANEILETAPRVVVEKEPAQLEAQGFVSLGTKLMKYFGKGYVKRDFPKKIYAKFPDAVKKEVTEDMWIGTWNTYILMGPLEEVKETVTKALEPYVWGWVAKSCGIIAQGIVYAIL
ncbi:hypothetical protein P4V86_05955 [Brevibacillus laterosporus]|uniref:hypothetical protein n=1 Tax=Brevibacillus laterosporus TaxID=1465 RepID=UPI00036410C7|nr:hypothetical protein [Brevibacillus laterosporus]ATO50698.1 hypothetical protein BrL25_17320 [Brevibacillus laterosporus DSM 25]MBG9804616.1 hypothetical protein [Brevibacillus laterosporus]MED2002902.1 hypothetical protein [Brevibacillus laterosporus]MED4764909.1 hypothetical protein [Brevibacillus laterosporus]TPH21343.1 hypothetical protein EGH09_03425 [Brevibacillus laterosporus]